MYDGEDRLVVKLKGNVTVFIFKPFPPFNVAVGDHQYMWRTKQDIEESNVVTSLLLEWLNGVQA